MTFEQRERIFSKEYLSVADVQEIFGLNRSQASVILNDIKRKHDRLGKLGKVHVQDYFDYFELNAADYRPTMSMVVLRSLSEIALKEALGVRETIGTTEKEVI